ncbi:GNAT family N-acetyltransferase [Mangrovibacterium marinum]|uniref:L-amino acid N-acyltransferase YncA n=1 Tax=Mangrovibacterium marinum TaxID=1639118 RepID=A0A2T5C2V4_9BACT|nr:hypothetical protein [Mangrovibacterium marinum]PTN09027.1 L-amino acid N-acyltransferase YncA [Mangrovibacterium marinum]
MNFRLATENDLEEIFRIASAWDVNHVTDKNEGFFVSSFSLAYYQKAFKNGHLFYLVTIDGQIEAFIYGYHNDKIDASTTVNKLIIANFPGTYFVTKQICRRKDSNKGKGATKALYETFIKYIDCPIVTAIVLKPYNARSVIFHEKMGFDKVLETTPFEADADGVIRPRGIWLLAPYKLEMATTYIKKDFSLEALVDFHQSAIMLYTHEDNLNWTKLGLNVTFMFAMMASTPFFMRLDFSIKNMILLVLVGLLGILINWLFATKLKSGLEYMRCHKETAQNLEKSVMRYGPNVPVLNVHHKNINGVSKTNNIMRKVPSLLLIIWVITFFFMLLTMLEKQLVTG